MVFFSFSSISPYCFDLKFRVSTHDTADEEWGEEFDEWDAAPTQPSIVQSDETQISRQSPISPRSMDEDLSIIQGSLSTKPSAKPAQPRATQSSLDSLFEDMGMTPTIKPTKRSEIAKPKSTGTLAMDNLLNVIFVFPSS